MRGDYSFISRFTASTEIKAIVGASRSQRAFS